MLNYVDEALELLIAEIPGMPDELLDVYVLLVFVKGTATSLEDVHDAWAIWKNRSIPNHKSLIPFDELTKEVQELDRKYMNAIRKVAAKLNGE